MKWLRDKTGRFRERPHYLPQELEDICEESVSSFLRDRYGTVRFPVSTGDLSVLIERDADDLDSGCDLDDGVDGLTDFFPGKRPKVKIANRLYQPHLENRLRTTLTHEYGHVRLHGFLFALDEGLKRLFEGTPHEHRNRCHRDDIEGQNSDWMEWQAGFASGALLMPAPALTRVVRAFRDRRSLPYADIGVETEEGQAVITEVVDEFQVSRDAARVRLEQRKAIVRVPRPGLF